MPSAGLPIIVLGMLSAWQSLKWQVTLASSGLASLVSDWPIRFLPSFLRRPVENKFGNVFVSLKFSKTSSVIP